MVNNKVLIIDDEDVVLESIRKDISGDQYEIYIARNGEEGLAKYKEVQPSLIILDLRMPVMDGIEFLERIKLTSSDSCAVIVLTGHGDEEEIKRCFDLGVSTFIRKPYNIYVLRGTVRNAIELKQSQQRLISEIVERKQSEEKTGSLANILEESLNEIYIFDAKTLRFVQVNKGARLNLGYSMEELSNLTPVDIKPEFTAELFAKTVEPLLAGESERIQFMTVHQRKNGSLYDVEVYLQLSTFQFAPVFVAIILDITERKRANEALLKGMRMTALGADIGVALTESDSLQNMLHECTETINKHLDTAFARIWTLNKEENMLELQASAGMYTHIDGPHSHVPVGKLKIGLIAQELKPHLTNNVINDPRIGDREWARREGMVAFAGYPLIVEDNIVGVMGMFARKPLVNDTLDTLASMADMIALGIERKRVENALRESEEKSLLLLNSTGEAIYGLDLEGNCSFCNPACLSMLGYEDESQLLSRNMHYLIHHTRKDGTPYPEEECCIYKAFRENKGTHVDDEVLWRADGTSFAAEYRSFPTIQKGKAIGSVVSFVDITERKKADEELKKYRYHLETLIEERTKELKVSQEKLIDSERLAVLGKLAGGIAHEIRNPLATIDISALNLKRKLKDTDEDTMKYIDRIIKQVKDSTHIIQSLQDMARQQAPDKDRLDICNIIEDSISSFQIPRTVKTVKRLAKKELFVDVDENQISIVFRNILSNAIHAMDNKGTIWITACREGDSWVEVSIKDTGHGISPENLKKVFQSFFGTKVTGFGYGLTICKMIMEKHGGTIDVQSGVGKGTTFILSFPSSDTGNYSIKKK